MKGRGRKGDLSKNTLEGEGIEQTAMDLLEGRKRGKSPIFRKGCYLNTVRIGEKQIRGSANCIVTKGRSGSFRRRENVSPEVDDQEKSLVGRTIIAMVH